MIGLSDIDLNQIDWNAVYRTPELFKDILFHGRLPDWLVELRKERLVQPTDSVIIKRKLRSRKRDCSSWIKKSNFQVTRARKRKFEIPIPKRSKPSLDMPHPVTLAQYQRHSAHLMSRVLNIRTNASPFTLILDDLNQSAMPIVRELVIRGLSRNVNIVLVSFEATRIHPAVRNVLAYGQGNGDQILQDIRKAMADAQEGLVIVDSLYDLLNTPNVDMNALFNLVAGEFVSTLVGIYHQDLLPTQDAQDAYAPQPLDHLKYLATSVMTCKSLAHVLAAKAAKERSLAEPTHGLLQGAEGIVQCLDANSHTGVVIEAEFRRKSGRPESEIYFLRPSLPSDYNPVMPGRIFGTLKQEYVKLLDQVPAYNNQEILGLVMASADEIESTFNLTLTDKQKEAREGVVLPYFDAQKSEGGEGGRILYDMGAEDDFDEEEDEI